MLQYENRTDAPGIRRAVDALRAGRPVELRVGMGSCQCGDIEGTLARGEGDVTLAHSTGREDWMRYDGPASKCGTKYGWGAMARLIAALVEGRAPHEHDIRFANGNLFTED